MNSPLDGNDDTARAESDREMARMQQHLRQDVAFWSGQRPDETQRRTAAFVPPPVPPVAAPAVRRVKAPLPPVAAAPPSGPKKPFSMSYSGMTSAQHIDRMIALRRG